MSVAIKVRPTIAEDITELSEFWYDKMVLLQQYDMGRKMMADGRRRWEDAVATRLKDQTHRYFTALAEDSILGCIGGCIISNRPGLLPEMLGIIDELIVDLHAVAGGNYAARVLFDALVAGWRQQGITHVEVIVPADLAVEQSFWRGMRARSQETIFRINL